MKTETLTRPPDVLPLYAKAGVQVLPDALPGASLLRRVPGASRLPFLGARGGDVPAKQLAVDDLGINPDHLAAYNKLCGFEVRDGVPATYPHILAFPLHLSLITDGEFPLPAVGLVHIENRIVLHRRIGRRERLSLRVVATTLRPHPKGRQFSIVSEARIGGELVWRGESTYLRRGSDGGGGERDEQIPSSEQVPLREDWELPGDLGRRHAALSGDRNPIHLYGWTARLFGFSRPIAHGMWTKARCLAALKKTLPETYTVEARFGRPLLLPARVGFASRRRGGEIRFGVRDAESQSSHLDGRVLLAN
jgi:acyl dehydratase